MSNKNKNRKGRKRDSRPDDIIRELDEVTEVTEDTEEPEAKAEDTDDGAEEKAAVRKEKKVPEKEALKDKPNKKKHRQAPPAKKNPPPTKKKTPPRDEAELARKSIKHTRTGGIPDEEPRRRRRRTAPSAEEIRTARHKEKRKRQIRTVAAVLIVAVFASGAYLTRAKWVPKLESVLYRPKETIVNDGEVKKGNFPLSFDDGSVNSINYTGSYLLCLDKNQLRFYNEDGVEDSAFNHNYADPVMRTSDKRVLLYDKGGSSLMVVGRKNELFTKSVKNRLIMAELAPNDNVAVVTSDEKYSGILTIYDGNGREIYKWSSSAAVLSVTFDDSGDGCFVTTYSTKNGMLGSVVRYLTFDSEKPEMVSDTLPVLALQAMKNDNGDIWVAGDTAFYRLNANGRIVTEYRYEGKIADFALSRSCAAVVIGGMQRRSSELLIFDSSTENDEPDKRVRDTDGESERLKISDSKIVVLKNHCIDCYDKFGNLAATAECSSDYSDFVYFDDNVYFCDYREVNKISFTT
ncbi:DUF5711 family protein [Ruminococcus albus]|uniref:Uncharacterized protein n=1 Tax=Ruminococcus albus (strain ATCC 27210 / DSM 20455 / JCM 14654 / NCDO 2250 / 7) TaxID=697329 RepID=E6UBA1_RUMA7|nr:DUF5711 family protein [Ruminococcus albus]ADU21451.1 hypothetical protein Rumal_0925 [Ruminococcus albus 7 = DSM 20455]